MSDLLLLRLEKGRRAVCTGWIKFFVCNDVFSTAPKTETLKTRSVAKRNAIKWYFIKLYFDGIAPNENIHKSSFILWIQQQLCTLYSVQFTIHSFIGIIFFFVRIFIIALLLLFFFASIKLRSSKHFERIMTNPQLQH